MITLANVHAKGAPAPGKPATMLRGVTLEHARGVLAIIGARVDGTTLLLSVLAGNDKPKSGKVAVSAKRPEIAFVPLDVVLPESLKVDEVVALADALRGAPKRPTSAVLATLGVEALGARPVRSLSRAETRSVALAIALASPAKLLLIEEPVAHLDPVATARVGEVLRARAAAGAVVVITTASVRDATRLGDHLSVLTQGKITALPPELAHTGPEGARLRIVVAKANAAALVGALAADGAVRTVETATFARAKSEEAEESVATAVFVTGKDLLELAAAVNRASHETDTPVEAIESAVMPLDQIRAALAAPRTGPLPSLRPPPQGTPSAAPPPVSVPPTNSPGGLA